MSPECAAASSLAQFRASHGQSLARLYQAAASDKWKINEDQFAAAAYQSVCAWRDNAEATDVDEYLGSLNGPDLALACACRNGHPRAWDQFITDFRPVLYRAASAMVRDEFRAREIADSLYADLYGIDVRAGSRRSLLDYFHGRSSLATWLKAVLAQRVVDAARSSKREAPLPDDPPDDPATFDDPPDPNRGRYVQLLGLALTAALRALKNRDRMRLNYYYLEHLTLKQIGLLMNEHESSVSRLLARTRKQLRRSVERSLRREERLTDDQIAVCYDYAIKDWPFDLGAALSPALSK
jgi:RNA polymerase sigma-70 factor